MFKNLHIKIFAVLASVAFWIFVVSLENTFFKFPDEIPVQVFNQAQDLALASPLGTVKLTIRTQDPNTLKSLSPSDFEAYIDLRNIGAGARKVPVSVSSKNSQVSVVAASPGEIEVTLEPVRQKIISIASEVIGDPAQGFKVESVELSRQQITVSGAETLLKRIASARGQIKLDSNERQNVTRSAAVVVVDHENEPILGLRIDPDDIEADVEIVEIASFKQIGIRPKLIGPVANGTVTTVEVTPAVVSVEGLRNVLAQVTHLETEPLELKDLTGTIERTLKLVLPAGVTLAEGEKDEVRVKVIIERT